MQFNRAFRPCDRISDCGQYKIVRKHFGNNGSYGYPRYRYQVYTLVCTDVGESWEEHTDFPTISEAKRWCSNDSRSN